MNILTSQDISNNITELSLLLEKVVDTDSSIGFIPPLSYEDATNYWQDINIELMTNRKTLFIARDKEKVVGCVQLSYVAKPNGLHRAEIEKLIVDTHSRGKGVAKALMMALEKEAICQCRSLLVLDTRKGDIASQLYQNIGYSKAGEIPNFAINLKGQLESTIYFYKILK
jgi:acetyltransferase